MSSLLPLAYLQVVWGDHQPWAYLVVRPVSEKSSNCGYKWGKYVSSTNNVGYHLLISGFEVHPDMFEKRKSLIDIDMNTLLFIDIYRSLMIYL